MLRALSASVLAYLIEEATDAVLIIDEHCTVRYVNPALSKLSGYAESELLGESINGLLPDAVAALHDEYVRQYLARAAVSASPSTVLGRVRELELRHRTGELIPIELKAVDLGVTQGVRYLGGFIVDIRRRKAIEAKHTLLLAQVQRQALTDSLTGLPNRRAFDSEAERIIARAKRDVRPVTFGVADIDLFKHVNDRHGHAAGDIVLLETSAKMQEMIRAGDLLGRIGGEEFGLAFTNATPEQALTVADRMRDQIAHLAIAISDQVSLSVSISIGLALLQATDSLQTVLTRADAALYRAKLSGRNCVAIAD